ncbi:DUF433 domain-containing protein [Longimicrobium terrae]|uniref:Uncharacterized protein (DUF433 family) n=1 Tax=Longimicrobium terrae TaxID=1639882 RepID=A0A841H5W4_9BACT|nr:uncharacterized protein (DUF433 family) [Longimicrobium terrae]MBB6073344.1 uncharacterized protein (DUF433 family) [Longimicrobium terrae]NNC28783.1 DUF433 domain-containing protein [Longimicrobium terrae]
MTDLPEKTIQQAIDRAEVRSLRGGGERERMLGYRDLVYLRLRSGAGRLLSPEGKRKLREELEQLFGGSLENEVVNLGPLNVDVGPESRTVQARLAAMERARAWVVSDPDVLAGEPVVRGTRISVHVVADLKEQGAGPSELLEEFPSLTPESLEAALLYARMYPRRGRPRRAPWKDGAPARSTRGSDDSA